MFGLFKSKPILSDQDTEFQIQTYKWLLQHFGGDNFYKETQLVLPTREFFPASATSNQEMASETFEAVKGLAGMAQWPCKLEAQEADVEARVAPTIAIPNLQQSPLGTFSVEQSNEITITYNPRLVSNPIQLVATLAHELSHYLTGTCPQEPPGGWENWEFATDITATFLGFGTFMVNSAFNFQQFTDVDSQGWSFNRSGYLSEAEHVFALAIFLALKDLPESEVMSYLKPSSKSLLKKAVKQVQISGIVDELRAVKFTPAL